MFSYVMGTKQSVGEFDAGGRKTIFGDNGHVWRYQNFRRYRARLAISKLLTISALSAIQKIYEKRIGVRDDVII